MKIKNSLISPLLAMFVALGLFLVGGCTPIDQSLAKSSGGFLQRCRSVESCNFYIAEQVKRFWHKPSEKPEKPLTVSWSVNLDRDGQVKSLKLLKSSGSLVLDESSRAAILSAAPFEQVAALDEMTFNKNYRQFKFAFTPYQPRY